MADNDKTKFTLDLDVDDFVKNAKSANEALKSVSNPEGFEGLLGVLGEFGPLLGVIAAAVLALKEGWDSVFDAEEIQAINAQFKIFTDLAGVSAEKLKEGFSVAADGWASETDLMKSANKAMLELQTGIERLPELMELSKKAALVMGGTMVEKFDQISMAIAAGNQRGLRNAGIIVDVQKAYRDYATQIGVTVDVLSKAGQQQALLNAVLDMGGKKLDGVDTSMKPVTSAWIQFKVAVTEAREAIETIINKVLGGTFKQAFTWMGETFKELNIYLKRDMGEGMDGMANKSTYLSARINVLRDKIHEYNDELKKVQDPYAKAGIQEDLEKIQHQYTETLKEASKLHAEMNKVKKSTPEASGDQASKVDPAKEAEKEAAAAKSLAELDSKITSEKKKNITSIKQADEAYQNQRLAKYREVEAQMAEVEAKVKAGSLSRRNADNQLVKLEVLRQQVSMRNEKELEAERTRALDNYLSKSKNTFDGIGRGFSVMSQKNQLALKNFGAIGEKTSASFASHMSGAFKAIGDGSKSATDALGGAFEGMVGDMATQYGEMMFLSSVWPPNPVGLAAGAALMALGGALSGAAGGGGGGSISSGAGAAGGGASSVSGGSDSSALSPQAAQVQPHKSVNLVFQGPIMGDTTTARYIADQVRNAADATDFKILSVGGQV